MLFFGGRVKEVKLAALHKSGPAWLLLYSSKFASLMTHSVSDEYVFKSALVDF